MITTELVMLLGGVAIGFIVANTLYVWRFK